jgi:outer membrane protein assembly factor BamB
MRGRFLVLAVVLVFILAGCVGQRQGISWPALSTVDINGQTGVVVAYEGRIDILDPSNGNIIPLRDSDGNIRTNDNGDTRRWTVEGGEFENAQFFADPLKLQDDGEDTLLFAAYNQRLLEFYVNTARVVNPAGISVDGQVLANIAATDDIFYLPYQEQGLAAVSRDSYEELWRIEMEEGVWAAPLLHEGVLYVTSLDHYLYAVDAETGEAVWPNPVDLEGAITSTPRFYEGHLYVGSYSHKMYKISLDGNIVAEHEGENWVWSTPVIYDGTLYYTDLSGNVYALNPQNLSVEWSAKPAERGVRAAPLVTEDYVVISSRDGRLYWLERETGSESFDREVEGTPELLSEILLLEQDEEAGIPSDIILVGSLDAGRLVAAFQLENGASLWTYGR